MTDTEEGGEVPWECAFLDRLPPPLDSCPRCGATPFEPFRRGQVQRSPWRWWGLWLFGRMRPWCAVICAKCKDIVGYEDPGGGYAPTKG
jgi:hypothetical protein